MERHVSLAAKDSKVRGNKKQTDLKGDMITAYANLEFLFPNNVLLGPIRVIFSTSHATISQQSTVLVLQAREGRKGTHLTISLDSTIRLSSLTTSGEIYTTSVTDRARS